MMDVQGFKSLVPFIHKTPTMGDYSKGVLCLPVFLESKLQE